MLSVGFAQKNKSRKMKYDIVHTSAVCPCSELRAIVLEEFPKWCQHDKFAEFGRDWTRESNMSDMTLWDFGFLVLDTRTS